jgi:hypothetical protein
MKTFNTWTAHPWGITEDKTKTPIARVSPLLDATESESLGRLIAAAPELLAICEEIANDSKCDLANSERRIRLYSALSKAKGKPLT